MGCIFCPLFFCEFRNWIYIKFIKPTAGDYRSVSHKAAAKKAGEDKLAAFGWYATLREVSSEGHTDDIMKAKPAHEVFALVLYKRATNKVEYRTNVFLSEDNLNKKK